jgi:hypothetical protein
LPYLQGNRTNEIDEKQTCSMAGDFDTENLLPDAEQIVRF